jgi:hypothetical protein
MKEKLFFRIPYPTGISFILLLLLLFVCSCASTKKAIKDNDSDIKYTVKVINSSFDKVLLRYQVDDLSYTFRFVDPKNELKFTMNGELTVQYSLVDYDNAKIIKIKQDTLIHIKQNDIIIDDLPAGEKIVAPTGSPGKTPEPNKSLEKTK